MNDTQRRFVKLYLAQALQSYLRGDIQQGDREMANALTWGAEVGKLIAQTFN